MGLNTDTKDANLQDWGLHYPFHYIYPIFVRWYRSDFHALPDAGGYDDQDPQKMDDLYILLGLLDFHMRKLDPTRRQDEPDRFDIYD